MASFAGFARRVMGTISVWKRSLPQGVGAHGVRVFALALGERLSSRPSSSRAPQDAGVLIEETHEIGIDVRFLDK